jgi:hypothetical protein
MNDSFQADPELLATDAEQFEGLAERAGRIHADLRTTLDSLGTPWGDDDAGRSFAGVHTAPADETLGRLETLPGKLGDVRNRFVASAQTYDDAETTGVTELTATEKDR